MRWLVDAIYLVIGALTSPFWLWRMARTGKLRTDWKMRFGFGDSLAPSSHKTILIHAVSVGEVNAIRLLVERLASHEIRPRIVIATTTDTGFARARELFSAAHTVVRYPFDFHFAVRRFLQRINPNAVALVELEVWPNFTAECERRKIPICVINGRLSARSFKRYKLIGPAVIPSFKRLAFAAVQNHDYAERFRAMGVAKDRIYITDTMKWDTATIVDDVPGVPGVPGARELMAEMGIESGRASRALVVAGSTAPEEHALLRDAIDEINKQRGEEKGGIQLLCAPRKPEWFDDAAEVLKGCARRSRKDKGSSTGRFLLDTIGELRKAYALADVVVVGRSFGELHGSDMMEPVALGKATIVGPAVSDFQDTADALLKGDGLIQTDAEHLAETIEMLLNDRGRRERLGQNGREVIQARQGATDRQAAMIIQLLE